MRQFFIGLAVCIFCMTASAQVGSDLLFKDFFNQPLSSKGLGISAKLGSAEGHRVRVTGYRVQQEVPHLGRFMLSPRPVQMSEHADGDIPLSAFGPGAYSFTDVFFKLAQAAVKGVVLPAGLQVVKLK